MEEERKIIKKLFFGEYRLTDFIIYFYLAAIFGLYVNIFDDKYFNITYTRYKCFMTCSIIFAIVFIIAVIVECIIANKYKISVEINYDKGMKYYARPDIWMDVFLCANIMAYFLAKNKKEAFTGEEGRYLGLAAIAVFFVVFMAIGNRFKMHTLVYMIFGLSTIWAHVVGIAQHHGYDFLHFRDRIAKDKKYVFISTFGNINIYASFICISVPIFILIYMYSKNVWYELVSVFVLVASGMALMVCASDSVYLGVGFAALLIFFIAFKDDKLVSFFACFVMIFLGNLLTVIMNDMDFSKHKKREGLSTTLDNKTFAISILVAMIVILLITILAYKKYGEKIAKLNKKKAIIYMLIALGVVAVIVTIVGIKCKSEFFVFNDKWGDYRGFVWRMSGEIYSDFPLSNKLFGYGNESVRALTTSSHYDEMIKLTHSVYDNCHNEILQFLLTTGLVGAIGYLGIFISSSAYILKNSRGDYLAYIPVAVMFGYFAQAMVCVSQPITTPLYYVFVAIGVGYARYLKSRDSRNDNIKNIENADKTNNENIEIDSEIEEDNDDGISR